MAIAYLRRRFFRQNRFRCAVLTLAVWLTAPLYALADEAAPLPAAPAGPGPVTPHQFILSSVNFFLLGFFVYYLLVLRPMQRRDESQKKFIEALKKNDEVVIGGGIFGRVAVVKPDAITVEVAPNVRLRVKPKLVQPHVPAEAPAEDTREPARETKVAKNGKERP